MKKLNFTAHILPHLVAIAVFFLVTIFFFSPIFFENKTLQQYDIQQFIGSSKAISDFREKSGEEALWTNSMFSGMPAYLISVQWGNQVIAHVKSIMALFLPHPVASIFIAFVCYYILLLSFGIRPWLAIAGAIAFGLSSYMIVGLAAGHNGRIGAIAFMPLIMAGIHLAFSGKRILGFGVTTAAMALHLRENHVQMTYYLLLIVLIYGLIRLIEAVRSKTLPDLFKTVAVLVGAVVLAAGTFFGQFWALKEYSAYSTRGQSDLAAAAGGTTKDGGTGMSKAYAFEFSNGILEPMTLMIPNFYGGSSGNFLVSDRESEVYKALVRSADQQTINQLANFTGAYWGEQRLAVPYYAGAITVFLFALGIAFAEKKHVWWLLSVSILSVVLSWGSNFSAFNYLMYDYFPGYDNFRSVTFALIMILFAMPLLGLLGLERLWSIGLNKATKRRLLIVFAFTGGLCLLLWMFAGMFSFTRDIEAQLPPWFVDALAEDRKSLFRADALRSFLFISVVFLAIYFDAHRKLSAIGFYAFLIFMVTIDVTAVDKRYFTDENYKRKRDSFFTATEADQEIAKDTSYYRVYNLSYLTGSGDNPFAEARTSYYHHSIGGYHGAKLRRYAEFYDSCMVPQTQRFVERANQGNLAFDGLSAFNMLNIKYVVIGPGRANVLPNNAAYGNAWFVRDLERTGDAAAELEATCAVNAGTTAVIDTTRFKVGQFSYDSAATISLAEYSPRSLQYKSQSSGHGLAVFSEIYYPGWEATIDGERADIVRVNYILRGLEIPAGNHTIEFTFNPKPYVVGNKVTSISSWLVVIVLLGSIVWSVKAADKRS